MQSFISALPKAELHVHLEGTLEPEQAFSLAARNGIELGYDTPAALRAAYQVRQAGALNECYRSVIQVLCTEQDFFELAYAYFKKAAAQGVVYVEPFFTPQLHTARGVDFDTMIAGLHRAQETAERDFGLKSSLVMGLRRDLSAASAMEHLELSLPHKERIIGVGLDSGARGNSPAKFADVFAQARAVGYMLAMHCDVNQADTREHLNQCLHLIHVDRIDQGIRALEDIRHCQTIAERGTGLSVCPTTSRLATGSYATAEIRNLLQKGIKVTINSDKPALLGAYLNDNFAVLVNEGRFTHFQILQLVENAFYVSWLPFEVKQRYFAQLRDIGASLEANATPKASAHAAA